MSITKTETVNYRVIAIQTNDFGAHNHGHPSKVEETVKWSGIDLDQLSREYPPSDVWGADELSHWEIEGGRIRYDYRFERQSGDGSWQEIDDPRRRITPVTDYERAIDEENRRLFPGDYITECSTCGYDDCQCRDDYYQYYCDSCRDEGCSQCQPTPEFYCEDCRDYGCSKCDPVNYPKEQYCNDCGRWFEAKLLSSDGICAACQDYRDEEAKPHCGACNKVHTDPVLKDGDICKDCDNYYNSFDEEWDDPQPASWYSRVISRLFWRR